MLITNGIEFLATLALIFVAVTLFCKKFPSKIYKYVPPVLIMFLIVVCCNTFGVWTMENESVNNTRLALTNYAIPFLVFLIGAQTDVKRMVKIGPKLAGVFLATVVSVFLGMIITYFLFGNRLGIDNVEGAFGAWTGSFVGGPENLYAIANGIGLGDDGTANVLLLINLVFRPWMTFLMIIVAAVPVYNKWTKANVTEIEEVAAAIDEAEAQNTKQLVPYDIFIIMGVGLAVVAISQRIGPLIGQFTPSVPASVWAYTLVTVFSVLLGTCTNLKNVNGLGLLGGGFAAFMLLVNCSAVDLKTFANAGTFLLCGVTCLLVHALVMAIYGKLAKVDLGTLSIASIASIGGVSSAPVVAAIYGKAYISISVIYGALGSMIGTFAGLGVYYLLRIF
ncbi:MAG: DUF819 family protein [Lachnospiraceae bacterium]